MKEELREVWEEVFSDIDPSWPSELYIFIAIFRLIKMFVRTSYELVTDGIGLYFTTESKYE